MKMDGGRQRIFIKLTLVEIDILIIMPTDALAKLYLLADV